jgi:hypothetical protein
MRHRSVFLVLFAVASLALSACSQLTAPRGESEVYEDTTDWGCGGSVRVVSGPSAGSIGFRCDTLY